MPAKSPQLVPLTASSQRSHLGHRLHDLSIKRPMRPRSIRLPKATPPTPLNLADPNRSYWRNQLGGVAVAASSRRAPHPVNPGIDRLTEAELVEPRRSW